MRMRYAVAGLFFALLCSCSPVPETEFALASVTTATARIDAGLAAVTVEPASRDRAVYPLPRSLTPLLPLWQAALQDAVTRQGIFRPEASRRLSLVVKVLEFSLSGNILSVFARYQLFDVPAGNPVFSADIMSNAGLSGLATGVTSLDDPTAATQNRTQVIRAIQDNITPGRYGIRPRRALRRPRSTVRQTRHPRRGCAPSPARSLDRLDDLEALKLGVAEIKRTVLPGAVMGEAERFRPRPAFEIFPAPPDRVG